MRNETTLARWARCGVLALGLAAVPSILPAQAGQTRIAYINFREVIQQDPGYGKAESTFRKELEGLQKGVEKLQQQFDSSMSEYTKQSVVLSPSAKQAKEKQLQTLQQQLQQRAQDFQGQVQKREQELMQPIEDRVRAVVEGVRAERNISVIFDVSGQANNIVAADKTLDITPTVLQRLKPGQ
jgi:outer membrane protein